MTRARVTAAQTSRPPKGMRMHRGIVTALTPLTVQIAGGGAVRGLAVPGQTYKVGDAVMVAVQEPAVGPVYPLAPSAPADLTVYAKTTDLSVYAKTAALAGYLPTTAFSALPVLTNLDTAPDGFAIALSGATGNPLPATVIIRTMSATINGTAWRQQRVEHENNGTARTRSSWQGAWGGWAATSTA